MKKEQKEAKKNKNEQKEAEEMVTDQQNLNEDAEQETTDETENEPKLSKEETLEAELAEAKDKYLRLYSEFDNYRRRTSKEKLEMMQTAGEQIIVSLLPVIDDFNRAEQSFDSGDAKAIIEGVKLISDKFVKILDGEGLKLMDTKEGAEFDTELHDAITQIPAPSKKLKGKIVDTIENGYYLGDKVIRHAKVVIGA
jgi:molecular chaperone GrpE